MPGAGRTPEQAHDVGAQTRVGGLCPDDRERPRAGAFAAHIVGHGRTELLEKAWDENADPFTNAVRVAVMMLRRKLGQPPLTGTVPGAGYRLGS